MEVAWHQAPDINLQAFFLNAIVQSINYYHCQFPPGEQINPIHDGVCKEVKSLPLNVIVETHNRRWSVSGHNSNPVFLTKFNWEYSKLAWFRLRSTFPV